MGNIQERIRAILNKIKNDDGIETWSRTLRDEHRLRAFEKGAEEDIWTEEG
jgi:hypothetical protein